MSFRFCRVRNSKAMRISGPVWHSQIDPANRFRCAKKKQDANQPVHRSPLRSADELFYWLVEFSKLSPFFSGLLCPGVVAGGAW